MRRAFSAALRGTAEVCEQIAKQPKLTPLELQPLAWTSHPTTPSKTYPRIAFCQKSVLPAEKSASRTEQITFSLCVFLKLMYKWRVFSF
jgi:hypothetical protein